MTPAPSSSASPNDSPAGVVGNDLLLGIGGKVCTKCGQEKPRSLFYSHPMGADGLRSRCKSCCRAECKKWDDAHPEKRREYSLSYHHQNPEKCKKKMRDRYWQDPQKARERVKEWAIQNPEIVRAARAKYNAENGEKISERRKKAVAELSDAYVKHVLTLRSDLTPSDIPQDLVELKRIHLKLKRTLKDNQP
jgi:hypothetical protein